MSPTRKSLDRSIVAIAISRLLWSQHRLEEDLPLQRIEDASAQDAKPFLEAGEIIVQLVLSPDLRDTALMAMADAICQAAIGCDDPPSIFQVSRLSQRRYLYAAEEGLTAFLRTLRFRSESSAVDQDYCRLLDAIAPKGGQS
jgi:hypothetical protein